MYVLMQEDTEPGSALVQPFTLQQGKNSRFLQMYRHIMFGLAHTKCLAYIAAVTHTKGLTLYMNTCHHQSPFPKREKEKQRQKRENKQTNKT